MRVFLENLWSSVKQIKGPYVFDWDHGIALHAMHGNRALSLGECEVSWFFLTCGGNWVIFSSYVGEGHSKLVFVQ